MQLQHPMHAHRLRDFHDLMQHRVMDILLVCSPYDLFILEEAGQLNERLSGEFRNLDLHYSPGLIRVSTGEEALDALRRRRFDLVISTLHVGDMNASELSRRMVENGWRLPTVLLAYDNRELKEFQARTDMSRIDRAFLWQGDARILLAITKYVEDQLNVAHDTASVGVQVIILIEDSVRYYSSFLPLIYSELLFQAQRLVSEGMNVTQKILRMRARPKILLCTTYEEAGAAFSAYRNVVLGVISDIEFNRGGTRRRDAGVEFARMVCAEESDVPVMLQSSNPDNEARASEAGAAFLLKGSPFLLQHLRTFMLESFGFGDFVFKMPSGEVVARATDLRSLEEKLATVPDESLRLHAERNHISRWLKARTDFALAYELRPRRVSDFASLGELRENIIRSIGEYREERRQGTVADFARETFDNREEFYRIGGGSLGGKARGLAFARQFIGSDRLRNRWNGVRVAVPSSAVIGTDVFDAFMEENGLRDFAIEGDDDDEIRRRFLSGEFPEGTRRDLATYCAGVDHPLAVRSSSLLEDSQYLPFSGVYETFMIPNDSADPDERLEQLLHAVRLVYASTFSRRAKAFLRATPYRLEEERMAVILQRIVGARHTARFYPTFAGVARSHNFYPVPPMSAEDGIAAVALGFGRTVVAGQNCIRFSPRQPRHVLQLSSVEEALRYAQTRFWALELGIPGDGLNEAEFGLEVAETDGTLAALASTYSHEDHAIHDGMSRSGPRIVTFAPILKHGVFPLAEILERLLESGCRGMGTPIEIEFAVNLTPQPGEPLEFGFLQIRPMALGRELEPFEIGSVGEDRLLCRSSTVMGHGRIEDIRDIVMLDPEMFDRSQTGAVAAALARLNGELLARCTPYVLIGMGRWGSSDPWLGIPVTWDQISGARVIVEAGLPDFRVSPSQGSHFFQNLTSFSVGFFTVNPELGEGKLDWDWLSSRPAQSASGAVRHLRLDAPLLIQMHGTRGEGAIVKPAEVRRHELA
jgi:CheY-like chemotaxis protein